MQEQRRCINVEALEQDVEAALHLQRVSHQLTKHEADLAR